MPQARSALFAARPLIVRRARAAAGRRRPAGLRRSRRTDPRSRRPAPAAVGVRTLVADAPVAGPPAPAADPAATPDGAAQHPSIAYEQAMAHADDTIAFKPGGRVKVGFQPRTTDDWPVDNRPPTSLPAGRATGVQMADSPQGSDWTNVGGGAGRRPRPTTPGIEHRPGAGRRPGGPDRRRAQRLVRRPGRRHRRPRGRPRAPAPGLRLPALLGALGRRQQAQQRRALDDRVLLGGRRPPREPARSRTPTGPTPPAGAAGRARA